MSATPRHWASRQHSLVIYLIPSHLCAWCPDPGPNALWFGWTFSFKRHYQHRITDFHTCGFVKQRFVSKIRIQIFLKAASCFLRYGLFLEQWLFKRAQHYYISKAHARAVIHWFISGQSTLPLQLLKKKNVAEECFVVFCRCCCLSYR